MLEALWTAEFGSSVGGFGSGVVVFEAGRVFGGNDQCYFTGTYAVRDQTVSAHIDFVHCSDEPSSIFAEISEVELDVAGKIEGRMTLRGGVVGHPTVRVVVKLIRRAELRTRSGGGARRAPQDPFGWSQDDPVADEALDGKTGG